MQNEIYDKENGLTYVLCGDHYLPELTLSRLLISAWHVYIRKN